MLRRADLWWMAAVAWEKIYNFFDLWSHWNPKQSIGWKERTDYYSECDVLIFGWFVCDFYGFWFWFKSNNCWCSKKRSYWPCRLLSHMKKHSKNFNKLEPIRKHWIILKNLIKIPQFDRIFINIFTANKSN